MIHLPTPAPKSTRRKLKILFCPRLHTTTMILYHHIWSKLLSPASGRGVKLHYFPIKGSKNPNPTESSCILILLYPDNGRAESLPHMTKKTRVLTNATTSQSYTERTDSSSSSSSYRNSSPSFSTYAPSRGYSTFRQGQS